MGHQSCFLSPLVSHEDFALLGYSSSMQYIFFNNFNEAFWWFTFFSHCSLVWHKFWKQFFFKVWNSKMSLFCFEHKILLSECASLFVWKTPRISEDNFVSLWFVRHPNGMTIILGRPIRDLPSTSLFLSSWKLCECVSLLLCVRDMVRVNSSVW